jgi:hypothetical protein
MTRLGFSGCKRTNPSLSFRIKWKIAYLIILRLQGPSSTVQSILFASRDTLKSRCLCPKFDESTPQMTLLFEGYCNAKLSKPHPLFFIRSTNLRFTLASTNTMNHRIQPIRLLAQQRRSFAPLPTNAPTQADSHKAQPMDNCTPQNHETKDRPHQINGLLSLTDWVNMLARFRGWHAIAQFQLLGDGRSDSSRLCI